jgi:hypothetical protein
MSNIMRDIYVTHGDKTIKFGTYLFKSESYDENVNKLLLSNQLSVEGFLKYIENEETQKIIKYGENRKWMERRVGNPNYNNAIIILVVNLTTREADQC